MAGGPSGGQTLTPNPNVNAPAGIGGDKWGANGGGIVPIGNGVTGTKGWDERVAATISDGQTCGNLEQAPIPLTNKGAPTLSVQTQLSKAALAQTSFDDALLTAGSFQG